MRLKRGLAVSADQSRRHAREGFSPSRRHPASRPHPRRHDPRAGGRGGLRDRRAHPPDLDPLPSGRGRGRPPGARDDPEQPVARAHQPDHPRLQLFLASGEPRRGPAPRPPLPGPCHGGRPCHGGCRRRARARWPGPSSSRRRPASARRRCRPSSRSALVCPVLTAHPTEVRRKSTIDREMEISQILAQRDRQHLTPEEEAACRGSPAPRHPDPLADEHPAPQPAQGDRRGR